MPENSPRAASIGWRVEVNRPCSGSVHSVFPRAVNCLVEGQLWTILHTEGQDAPFGLRLEGGVLPGDLGARPGDAVRGRAGFLKVGSAVLDCRAASRWKPNLPAAFGAGWVQRFDLLGRLASPRAWTASSDLAATIAAALLERPAGPTLQGAVNRAVGNGPGLTPAGDDVLVGLLAGLSLAIVGHDQGDSDDRGVVVSRLARAWHETPSRTTDISRHLIDQASAGLFGAGVHALIRALAGTDARAVRSAADGLLATGASSGADTCVGVAACGPLLSRLRDYPGGILP
jgi:hypothetical protein